MGIETAVVQYLDHDGATAITSKTLPDAEAGVNQMPVKFGMENVGSRALANVQEALASAGGDGLSMSRIAADTVTLSRPYGAGAGGAPTATLSGAGAGGVWGAPGTRGWRVAAYNAEGETVGSREVTANVDDVTKKVTLAWTEIVGAAGYKVYRTATPGTYGASSLRATLVGSSTTSYVDDGGATGAGAPAAANTTAGWLPALALSAPGAGGVWGAPGARYYRVAAYDTTGQPVAASLEAAITVDDVTKTVTVSWAAINGASTYKVFRSTVAGSYLGALLATTTGLNLTDTGTAPTAGDLTLGPSYGNPPTTFGTTPVAFGNLAIGQQLFFWFRLVIPVFALESTEYRAVLVTAKET